MPFAKPAVPHKLFGRQPIDGEEVVRLQACPSDQPAIDVGYREDFRRICGVHAAAIKDPCFVAGRTKALEQQVSDQLMCFADLLRVSHSPGPNGPYRFIRHDNRAGSGIGGD